MKSKIVCLMVCALTLGVTGILNAGVISLNFDNAGTLPGTMETSDLAGASGVRVGNWNNWIRYDSIIGDADQTILDDSGVVVAEFTATISNSNFVSRDNNHDNDQEMYSDVLDVSGAVTVSISNIPYSMYDIYVYMRNDGETRGGSFTIGETTYYARGGLADPLSDGTGYVLSSDTTLGAGTDVDQGNYVRFSSLSDSNITLTLNVFNAGNSTKRSKVAGLQIVGKQVVPVIPTDRAIRVSIDQDLQWTVVDPNATHIDLYFGPEDDPNLTTNPAYKRLSLEPVSTTTWDPGTMGYQQKYYWHIDLFEPNELGSDYIKRASETWSFETESAAPVIEIYDNVVTTTNLLPAVLSAVVTDADNNISSAVFAVTSSPEGSTYTLTQDVSNPYAPVAELESDMPGTYEVALTVTDGGANIAEATVQVVVYDDACAAAQAAPSWAGFNAMDFDHDCNVNMADLAAFALQWLDDRNLTMQETYAD